MAIERVLKAIEEIKAGKMIIMIDDEDRENEGDLVYASALSTPDKVNFMAKYARGLICTTIDKSIAIRLGLNPMVNSNNSNYETAFTISVDDVNADTGISAKERDDTIKIIANPISHKQELVAPGHIFPLIAKDGGVLERTGHTEGSFDLCKLAGINGGAVICEIIKDDGTMARRDDLDIFGEQHNLHTVFISDLVEYRLANESLIELINNETVNFLGTETIKYEFQDHLKNKHTVIKFGDIKSESNIKFHIIDTDLELLTNYNRFNSLNNSIKFLQENSGLLIFLGNHSTEDNDKIKGFGIGAQIINYFNIKNINLLTSSKKHSFVGIDGFGLNIIKEINI